MHAHHLTAPTVDRTAGHTAGLSAGLSAGPSAVRADRAPRGVWGGRDSMWMAECTGAHSSRSAGAGRSGAHTVAPAGGAW